MAIDVMEQMRAAFRAEAQDLLIELDSALLLLEENPEDASLVHRVFRAIHTIKGSGATAGNVHLARFAHKMEEAFDLARDGLLSVTPDLIDCGLKACDVIRLILESGADGEAVEGELEATGALARLLPTTTTATASIERIAPAKPAGNARAAFQITFKPKLGMFYSGSDPVTLLDDLRALGQAHITAHTDQVPLLSSLEAEHCYLWWQILLSTDEKETAIRNVFVFVEDDCEVDIQPLEDEADCMSLLASIPPEMFELFVIECEENLDKVERDALELERSPASREVLDSLFRGVHSIKGNSGLLLDYVKGPSLLNTHPLQVLLRITHALESLLDSFRGQAVGPVSEEAVHIALDTCDAMRGLLRSFTPSSVVSGVPPELLQRLGVEIVAKAPEPVVNAGDVAFLNTATQCVETIAGCLSRLEGDPSPTSSILSTYIRALKTLATAGQYRNVADLEEPLAQQLSILDSVAVSGEVYSSEKHSSLALSFAALRSVVERLKAGPTAPKPLSVGNSLQAQGKSVSDSTAVAASPATIRVDQVKMDRLMTIVGELLVSRGAIPLLVQAMSNGADASSMVKELKDVGSSISRIADELQTTVMSLRMLPVKTVFQRFPRLVRDLARSLGKEVQLVIEGEGIELDKTILEQIGDPLVHLIRNAVDHGLELPEERLKRGKVPAGQLTLRATHEAGSVAIEVKDDGRGLDAAALKKKAVSKGLLTPEAADAMSEEAAFQLIFLPGLSTANQVTDVSGRGVGMDVVHSNVRNLQGTVEIKSKLGQGTTLLIRLPTSLMVSKGILLEAGGQRYILPLSNIRDMVKLKPEVVHTYGGQTLAQVRGTIYSILDLAHMLGLVPGRAQELSIAIVEAGALRYGLLVDKFLTEVEVLVKPLTGWLEHCKEFQGAAIMGNGDVVLVLNALECYSLGGTACS